MSDMDWTAPRVHKGCFAGVVAVGEHVRQPSIEWRRASAVALPVLVGSLHLMACADCHDCANLGCILDQSAIRARPVVAESLCCPLSVVAFGDCWIQSSDCH